MFTTDSFLLPKHSYFAEINVTEGDAMFQKHLDFYTMNF